MYFNICLLIFFFVCVCVFAATPIKLCVWTFSIIQVSVLLMSDGRENRIHFVAKE